MVSKWSIENCKKCWLHNCIPYKAKSCLKWLSSKGCNSVKINSSSTKNAHAHLQYVHNRYARLQKDPLKTVGGVDYTLYAAKFDEWTDRQTGANLNAPWLSSQGHKNNIKKAHVKFQEDLLYFQHFILIFVDRRDKHMGITPLLKPIYNMHWGKSCRALC